MRTIYDASLKATISLDDADQIRAINHLDEYREIEKHSGREAAAAYVRDIAERLKIAPEEVRGLEQPVSYFDPKPQGVEYRFSEEKSLFDSATYAFYQTYLNTPVWEAGITATLKQSPARIVGATITSERGIDAEMPSSDAIGRYRQLFTTGEKAEGRPSRGTVERGEGLTGGGSDLLSEILGKATQEKNAFDDRQNPSPRLIRGRFFVYRYDPAKRTDDPKRQTSVHNTPEQPAIQGDDQPLCGTPPTLPLPPVPESIREGRWYVVSELIFRLPYEGGRMNWRALVEVETNGILYLRALTSGVNGNVFIYDPITSTGTATNTANQSDAVLNPRRSPVTLPNLNAPVGATQSLAGSLVALADIHILTLAPPTRPAGSNFDTYNARTNEFAAVNAYYHNDRFFQLVESLGFPRATYFDGTAFPVEVDHRGAGSASDMGNLVNAHCIGDGDGIDHACYALADLGDTVNPIGIAADWRVVLHELGGHGILYDHVGTANFGFSHSAGDSFAMVLNDYISEWHNGAAIDRFVLAPFITLFERRSDKGIADFGVIRLTLGSGGTGYTSAPSVTISGGGGTGAAAIAGIFGGHVTGFFVSYHGTGFTSAPSVVIAGGGGSGATATSVIGNWAWGGTADLGGYLSEQILSTTMFRFYRSIGGDSTNINRRQFAARCTSYLMLRAVGTLTPMSNPGTPALFLAALQTADAGDWTSEGVYGGAYGKVLTWSFEKQNLNGGARPPVDVYIDDGRAGEYTYQPVFWNTTTIWNRRMPDGMPGHEEPALGVPNYAYVQIKNRGTSIANDVIVKGYHSRPAAGVWWPNDLQAFTTAQLSAGTLAPNNTETKTVGPFEWTPIVNAYGHDCMFMIVSATGDPSNVDNLTAGGFYEDWRLVPNDNNIGQRNVTLAPGGGLQGLIAGLDGKGFWIGNTALTAAKIEVSIKLPPLLESRGWRISLRDFPAEGTHLKAREQRLVTFEVHAGEPFTKADASAANERDIVVTATADGAIIGGMVYRIDPELEMPFNDSKHQDERKGCRGMWRHFLAWLKKLLTGK